MTQTTLFAIKGSNNKKNKTKKKKRNKPLQDKSNTTHFNTRPDISFQDDSAAAQYYFRFRIWWRYFRQTAKIYLKQNVVHIHHGRDIITSGLENTSAMLYFYFRFRFRPHHRTRHVTRHYIAKFCPYRIILSGDMMLYDFQDGGQCGAILLPLLDWMTSLFLESQCLSANQIS